jgi:hypothetical protein
LSASLTEKPLGERHERGHSSPSSKDWHCRRHRGRHQTYGPFRSYAIANRWEFLEKNNTTQLSDDDVIVADAVRGAQGVRRPRDPGGPGDPAAAESSYTETPIRRQSRFCPARPAIGKPMKARIIAAALWTEVKDKRTLAACALIAMGFLSPRTSPAHGWSIAHGNLTE